jgi:hypothetical protein
MEISKTKKNEVPYISLKACPVCGEHPGLRQQTLERPGGHGYPGCFTYEYKCEYCKLLKSGETTDIYVSAEEAKNLAKELWNEEVDRVSRIMTQAGH